MQWYRVDLHLHTPASQDYQEPHISYLDILRRAEARGLDIIAFTDHNSVGGFAAMMNEVNQLEMLARTNRISADERPRLAEYRRLLDKILVLPGFEFTATLGFHILGIFHPRTRISMLEHTLLSLNIPPLVLEEGNSIVGASSDVLTAYRTINNAGGIVIAAHVNSTHGVMMRGFDFGGQTKIAYTQDPYLHALEVTDLGRRGRFTTETFFSGTKNEYPRRMRCIQGSDAHRLSFDPRNPKNLGIGDRPTEVLLPERSFEALRELLQGNDFARSRGFRGLDRDFIDRIHAAREDGANETTAFHESMTVTGGRLYGVMADVAAMTNTEGGTIFVGLSPDITLLPLGVEYVGEAIAALEDEIRTRITPTPRYSIDVINYHERQILQIEVERGQEAPYAIEGNRVYVRNGADTVLATREQMIELVRRGAGIQTVAVMPAERAAERTVERAQERSARGSERGGREGAYSKKSQQQRNNENEQRRIAANNEEQQEQEQQQSRQEYPPAIVQDQPDGRYDSNQGMTDLQADQEADQTAVQLDPMLEQQLDEVFGAQADTVSDSVAPYYADPSPVDLQAESAVVTEEVVSTTAEPVGVEEKPKAKRGRKKKEVAPVAEPVMTVPDEPPPILIETSPATEPAFELETQVEPTYAPLPGTASKSNSRTAALTPASVDDPVAADFRAYAQDDRQEIDRAPLSPLEAGRRSRVQGSNRPGRAERGDRGDRPESRPSIERSPMDRPQADRVQADRVQGDRVQPDRSQIDRAVAQRPSERLPVRPDQAAAPAANNGDTTIPRTGVEIVGTESRRGEQFHMIRDLRNPGKLIKDVTRGSARKLWLYAVVQKETNPPVSSQVQWNGNMGVWRFYKRGDTVRYDLVMKESPTKMRMFYGVTEEGMRGNWANLIRQDQPDLVEADDTDN